MSSERAFFSSPEPTAKHSTYFHVYDRLLSIYQGKKITFVEVGVLNGGSLFMWRKFFGPNARIIGVDLNPEAKKWEQHGFEIFIGSQSSPSFWQQFFKEVGSIDILLDDGGHTYLQQIITAEMALDHINDEGMLIIEDTHTSYARGFGDLNYNFINYTLNWINKINSRFSTFNEIRYQQDRRVWSVEVFESIVAFKVDKVKSETESQLVFNKIPEKSAIDYRDREIAKSPADDEKARSIIEEAFAPYPKIPHFSDT